MVFGNKKRTYSIDLLKGIIVNIRNLENNSEAGAIKKSSNELIAMLEELLSGKSASEKKRVLTDEYGMIMTAELEGRIQIMCNLSENIEARGIREGMKEGMKKERFAAIKRMIKAGAAKEQIISYGYTEEEYKEAENSAGVDV